MSWYDPRWYVKVLRQYADFSGRAQRAEYWMFILINMVVSAALSAVDLFVLDSDVEISMPVVGGVGPVGWVYNLAVLIPTVAVGVRRLHDCGRSGWWQLLAPPILMTETLLSLREAPILAIPVTLIVIIGGLILLIMLITDGTPEPNRWGVNPKSVRDSASNSSIGADEYPG